MSQLFESTKVPAIIDVVTYAGSAFAVNEQGQQIFVNSRIVDRCDLSEGSEVIAYVVPNYEDKRDHIPWRALRVEVPRKINVQSTVAGVEAVAPAPVLEPQSKKLEPSWLEERIFELLANENGYWTTTEIADEMDIDTRTAGNALHRLFTKRRISKADVHANPDQGRASFVLWTDKVSKFA
jgi:hypothetical protein